MTLLVIAAGDVMARAVEVTRRSHSAADLRKAACTTRMCAVARCWSLAMILEGERGNAQRRRTGMDRQTLCDWVHRYKRGWDRGTVLAQEPGQSVPV